MPDENTAGRHDLLGRLETSLRAVVIETGVDGVPDHDPAPVITADEAAELIRELHTAATEKGYVRIRLDRGVHPGGTYYELGYVHGEVGVRLSHSPNQAFRRPDPTNVVRFRAMLAENARAAS